METSIFRDNNFTALCSEKTLQSDKNGFFLNFADHVLESAGTDWLKEKFSKLKTDRDRIKILFTDQQIKSTIWETLSNVRCIYRKKDAEISKKRLAEGKLLMKQGISKKALMLFCQSVLRAPIKDEENTYVLALFNRAQSLTSQGHLKAALTDLSLLQKYNPPDEIRGEVFSLSAQIYHTLGDHKKSKVACELARRFGKKEIIISVMKRVNERPEPVMPSVTKGDKHYSDMMVVQETAEMGRFMVAKEDIKTGDTLIVEKPFVACLLPDCFGSHCHNCFKSLLAPVGCPDCSSVAFCSTSCQEMALSSYHRYECHILDLLIGSGMSVLCHAALRTITQVSDTQVNIDKLVTHADKRDHSDMLKRTLMAAFLLRCLMVAGYFGDCGLNKSDFVLNEEELSVGERLLRNLQILQFNAHEIYETRRTTEHKFKKARTAYIAIGLYPTTALLNHDCYPAVTRYFCGKNVIIKATRPTAKGEMIAENYGPIFLKQKLADRQRSLYSRYWFQCQCQACKQDWPMLEKLENTHGQIRCPNKNCYNLFMQPIKEVTTCLGCRKKVNLKPALDELKQCEKMYQQGMSEMDAQNPEKAISIICDAIDNFHRIASAPHKDTHLCQEALRTCMAESGNVFIAQ